MSQLRGKIGPWQLTWASLPKGGTGSGFVKLADGTQLAVSWRRDADGLWIETPDGVYGFDVQTRVDDDGAQSYGVSERGTGNRWDGLAFRRAGDDAAAVGATGKRKGLRVRAQMPGKIVRVLVKEGVAVEKDQPLIVMEAMKMENEIRAPGAGKVVTVKVTEGQAVETGAELLVLE